MRFTDANILTINSGIEIGGNLVIDGAWVTGSMVLNDGFANTPSSSYAYFTMGDIGPRTGSASPTSIPTSLLAQHAIQASQFVAVSDQRVKSEIREATTTELAEAIAHLPVKVWKYKDTVQHGDRERLGFIAQDVPACLSKFVVGHHEDFLPDIFSHAVLCSGDRTYHLANHGLKKGDTIRYCTASNTATAMINDVPTPDTFTLDASASTKESIFVYGKYAKDVLNVDYDAIVAALVAAVQSLNARLASLESK